ncbi:hypothetical protein FVR03_01415 [Pontibacter qinzhouensis]|uniref:Uncharacterized protein n=1 Tax=Pontibacter qinzhouensis TaxID=2603253 RepID=A0A5C8KFR3_9BACT|nr:hypothetical protein [Pontibacter qinzhouensis]TXK52403.1 hypothetical protein FVR03_01415 [Pontibacter qinzhouensis]
MNILETIRESTGKSVNLPLTVVNVIAILVQIVAVSYIGGIKNESQSPTPDQIKEKQELKNQQSKIFDLLQDIKTAQQTQVERNQNTDRRLLNIEEELKYIRYNYQPKPGK